MKIIMDIPDDVYVHGKRYQRPNDVSGFVDVMLEGLATGVPIQDYTTNGEVVELLFNDTVAELMKKWMPESWWNSLYWGRR